MRIAGRVDKGTDARLISTVGQGAVIGFLYGEGINAGLPDLTGHHCQFELTSLRGRSLVADSLR